MQKIEISDYYSDDETKKATVFKQDNGFGIDFYSNGEYDHTLIYLSKSLQFVEDAAENYVMGIFNNYKDYKEV